MRPTGWLLKIGRGRRSDHSRHSPCRIPKHMKKAKVVPSIVNILVQRASLAWRDAIGSGIAMVIAWVLPQWLFGHEHPMFATVTAIVCLAPGLPNHFRQTVGMLIGVATGIVIGEVVFFLPDDYFLLRLVSAATAAVFIPALYGLAPVVAIQSGVSAVLVLVLGAHDAGPARMLDVMVGAGVGLLFSQVLLTPDPIRQIDLAAHNVLDQVLGGLRMCQGALDKHNASVAERALQETSRARVRLSTLDIDLGAATDAATWSLRGRLAGREVARAVRRYDRHVIRVYASALLFADALFHALRDAPGQVPETLTQDLAAVVGTLAADANAPQRSAAAPPGGLRTVPPEWARCLDNLAALAEAIDALGEIGPVAPGAAGRRVAGAATIDRDPAEDGHV